MNRCELSSRRFALSKLAAQWAVSPLGIAALGLIAIFVRLPQLSAHVFVFDEAIYFMASRSVAEHGYVWANMRAIGHAHPPAFFVLQASWFRLAERLGVNVPIETLHRLPSVVLAGLTTALTYLLGVNIDRLTGWLAAVVFALHPLFVAYTRLGVLESLLLFSCVLTLNLYLWALKSDERRRRFLLSLSGLAMSVAILTKVYAVILVPVLVLHRAIMTIGDRHRTKLLWMSRGCLAELAVFGTAVVGGLLLFSTIWANDPLLLYRIWTTAYGWTSGVNRGRLWVYDSLLSHLGFIIVIFAGQGLAIVALQPFTSGFVKRATALYEPVPLREYLRHLIFPLIILAWGSAFSLYTSTQFDRYLLPLALIILVLFAYGVSRTARSLSGLSVTPALSSTFVVVMVTWSVAANAASLPRVYRALIIDDWWHIDGFRAVAKAMSSQDNQAGEFFITNGHYPVLSAYTGLPGGLSLSFDGDRPRTYWIWYGDEATTTIELTPELESRLKYIVLVQSFSRIPPEFVLFSEELDHTWNEVDASMIRYVETQYRPVLHTNDAFGNVALFERGEPIAGADHYAKASPAMLLPYLGR